MTNNHYLKLLALCALISLQHNQSLANEAISNKDASQEKLVQPDVDHQIESEVKAASSQVQKPIEKDNRVIDPMLPKEFADTETEQGETLNLRLKAIGMNEHIAYCIINGKLLAIDDIISGYKVVKITANSVTLEDDELNQQLLYMK